MLDYQKLNVFFDNDLVPFEAANVSIASSAVLYGLSVYTVFSVNITPDGSAAFRLPEHFGRLVESSRIIGIDTFQDSWSFDRFKQAVAKLITQNNITQDVLVRASVHVVERLPGTRSRGLKTILSMFIYPATPILPLEGARLKTSVWRRVPDNAIPARAKVNGAYVNSVLAKQDAIDSGYDDCILLDTQGHVCELSAANIFLVKNNTLVTPGVSSDILEGINRRTIIELAKNEGLEVQERQVDLTELYTADEVFACGTSAFVAPVIAIDARQIGDGQPGTVTGSLAKRHRSLLHGEDSKSNQYLTVL